MRMLRQTLLDVIADAGPEPAGRQEDQLFEISGVSAIPDAHPQSAVFATDKATFAEALKSAAGLIFASPAEAGGALESRVVLVRDPRLAFALLGSHVQSVTAAGVHATAVVSSTAYLEGSVAIAPGAVIAADVRLGQGCRIGARVVIEQGTVLGERVTVQAGAVLGAYGFGYARRPSGAYVLFPQQGVLVIEDDVEIGANTTIDRGALGETRIGRGTKIDNLVHIAHNCRIGCDVIIAAQTGISGSTVVEDGAILGGQVGIGEHATVGKGVILGGGAGVLTGKKLFGAGKVFWVRPAQPLKHYLRDMARLRRG